MVPIANATVLVPELRGVLSGELRGCFLAFRSVPGVAQGQKVSDRHAHWRNLILVFADAEMGRILRRTGKDRFFQFGIDPVVSTNPRKVVGTRGGVKDQDLTPYLLEKRGGVVA